MVVSALIGAVGLLKKLCVPTIMVAETFRVVGLLLALQREQYHITWYCTSRGHRVGGVLNDSSYCLVFFYCAMGPALPTLVDFRQTLACSRLVLSA